MDINIAISLITSLIALVSTILLAVTISANKRLNQNILFNEIVKQERSLRVILNKYRKEIQDNKRDGKDYQDVALDYDTLLLNYYEYLSICIYHDMINENKTKTYFKEFLKGVRDIFNESLLFKEGYANKNQYPGINWLIKKWLS